MAMAYLAASWLVIQVADTMFPVYGLGNGALNVLITALAIGFPFFLLLSWVFRLTPQGFRREINEGHWVPSAGPGGKRWNSGIIVILALALGYFAFDKFVLEPARDNELTEEAFLQARSQTRVDSYRDKSIVVLPFANMSEDASNVYFSDGIAEEILNLLAKIPELRVVSHSSAFAFRGRDIYIPDLARKLNVTHVLEGSVRKAGNRVRIAVQLIDAYSDIHLWSEIYDRPIDNIFAIQEEISLAVAEAMKVTLIGNPPVTEFTSTEAHELFLQGIYFYHKRTVENYGKAIDYLNRSLALDPDFSPAWIGLGSAYSIQARMGTMSYDVGYQLARDASERAINLDPDNALARSLRAWVAMTYERDYALAASNFRRALDLQPNNTAVLANSATLAGNLGRLPRSIELNHKALKLDPTLTVVYTNLSQQFSRLGRLEDAESNLRKALELNPEMYGAPGYLAIVRILQGKPDAALELGGKIKLEHLKRVVLAIANYDMGDVAESNRALEAFIKGYADTRAYYIAWVYAWRREYDSAFEWLTRAIDENQDIDSIKTEVMLQNLHEDPRWKEALTKLGLDDSQVAAIEI